MLIHGSPIAVTLPADPSIQERFWYWTGASGRRYIHSVYAVDACPPLPGAIYVAVRRQGPLRIVVGLGRFQPFWDGVLGRAEQAQFAREGVDELHVHLLSRAPEQAAAVLSDLADAFEAEEGLAEARPPLSPAPEVWSAAQA
jgi:hypothetical protein